MIFTHDQHLLPLKNIIILMNLLKYYISESHLKNWAKRSLIVKKKEIKRH